MARSQLKKLGTYLSPHWPGAALGIGALFVVNLVGVWIPLLIRNGIDELQVTFSFGRVMYYALMVLVLASVMWVIRMVSRITLFGVGRQVEFDLKQRIFQHLLAMEPAYFGRNTAGELISRATSDVDNIRRLLGFAILSLANTLFAYALTVPVMLSISVRLTLISLLVYPVMLALVQTFSDRLRRQQLDVQERIADLSDLIQEDMSGIALIKIYAQEGNERRAFNRLNNSLLDANLTLSRTRTTLFPLLGGLASISLLVILATGAGAIADGLLTVGDFVALLLYVERLVFPTALLGFTITAYQRGEVSINRVEEILDAEPRVQTASTAIPLPLEQVRGALEARQLSYAYPDSKAPALDGVNFAIAPGEQIAIVGERGITLSGGQRQRTALARALVIDAPILVLDDALSSVDNRTATAILNALSEGTQQKTVLFISHQMSAAATADRIFVMDQGRIVQQGHHRELVQQAGLYRDLWEQHQLESALQ